MKGIWAECGIGHAEMWNVIGICDRQVKLQAGLYVYCYFVLHFDGQYVIIDIIRRAPDQYGKAGISIMRDYQKIAAFGAACLLLTGTAGVLPVSPAPAAITAYAAEKQVEANNVVYTLYDDHAAVYDYHGREPELTIPDMVEGLPVTAVEDNAFCGSSVKHVILPESVSVIGNEAFGGLLSLKSVTCPGVREIGRMAFYMDENLESVTLPEGLTKIGMSAFHYCKALAEINAPATLQEIGGSVFQGTAWLDAQTAHGGPAVLNHIVIDGSKCKGVVTLSSDVKAINAAAFSKNTEITDVIMPLGLTKIGSSAFSGCTGLTSLTLPDSVTEIPAGMCNECTALAEIHVSDQLTAVGERAFSKTALTTFTFPDGVTVIEDHTFDSCEQLVGVEGKNITKIGNQAFRNCKSFKHCVCDYLTEIDDFAFMDCTEIFSFQMLEVKRIGNQAFRGCTQLSGISLYDRIRTVEQAAFSGCTALHKVYIFDPLVDLDVSIFDGCKNVEINGYDGSTAEQYAAANNLQFVSIGSGESKLEKAKGDFNDDNTISVEDAQLALINYTELFAGNDPDLTPRQLNAADVNKDGKLTVEDAQYILQYYTETAVAGKSITWRNVIK